MIGRGLTGVVPYAQLMGENVFRAQTGTIAVRDTANRDGGTLVFTADAWRAFAAGIKRS